MNLIHPLDDTTFGKFTTFDQLNSQVSTNSQDFEPDKAQGWKKKKLISTLFDKLAELFIKFKMTEKITTIL